MATKVPAIDPEEVIRELFQKWSFLVTNQGYYLDIEYYKNHLESGGMLTGENTSMQCWPSWAYQSARIAINLSVVDGIVKKEGRIEWIVVHELVHILQGDPEYESDEIYGRACSEMATAIILTYNKYKK